MADAGTGRTEVFRLAEFVDRARFDDISLEAQGQLKVRVLDTLGVAIGALDAEPMIAVRSLQVDAAYVHNEAPPRRWGRAR